MKNIIILIGIILLISTNIVIAQDMLSDYNFNNIKSESKNIRADRNIGFIDDVAPFNGWNIWIASNNILDDGSIDYSKDFWMPIEPWEYQVCSRGLETQLTPAGVNTVGGAGVYDITITVVAYKTFNPIDSEQLYEITWYFNPGINQEHTYSIEIKGSKDKYIVQSEKKADSKNGDTGYQALYSESNYTEVILNYNDITKKYPIIDKP